MYYVYNNIESYRTYYVHLHKKILRFVNWCRCIIHNKHYTIIIQT